jgi:hypothetical protein
LAWVNDWAPHHGSVDGNVRPVVQQGFDLFWKDKPLQSVKRCDMLPLVPGRSCERGRKGVLKALLPVLAVGHSFLKVKAIFQETFAKILHWPMTHLGLWL